MLQRWFLGWVVLAVAVVVTVAVFPGIEVDWHPGTYLLIAAVFAAINLVLGPILRLLSLPVMAITLGLFSLVINTGLFLLTAGLMDSLHVDNIGAAFGGSILISLVRAALGVVLDRGH
jgi:putative membrane protein